MLNCIKKTPIIIMMIALLVFYNRCSENNQFYQKYKQALQG